MRIAATKGLWVGAAGAALLWGGGAHGQSYPSGGYAPGYPYPPAGSASGYGDPRYADAADYPSAGPAYQGLGDARYQDPRYQDPRYADPRYRAWLNRYYRTYDEGAYPPPARRASTGPAAPVDGAPSVAAAPAVVPAPLPAPPAPVAAAALPAPHLPHRLLEAAQAYADYLHKAAAIDAGFGSGAAVAAAVKTGAGYEANQFQEGAIAYAALTALQEPEFIRGARELLREGDRGADFADQLVAYPQAALNIRGADLAAARAATALRRHGEHLFNAGAAVKAAAYNVQHSDWSKGQVVDPDGRLALAKAASATRAELKGEEAPELTKAVLAETVGDGQPVASPIVSRALAVAALAALGQLQESDDVRLTALLAEPKSADCLKMAKLNLFQCLSVARPHYEDIFCLGEHAMMETGQCVVKAAGYTPIPPAPIAWVAPVLGKAPTR